MVNSNMIRIIGVVAISAQLAGCSMIRSIWGEKAPPRKTVKVESQKLPEITDIFNNDEDVAQKTLDQYKKSILDSFDQIKGKEKDRLSMEEIESLARAGLAKLSEKQETNIKRIRSVLTLLGFKDGISRAEVVKLLTWVEDNRIQGKAFYDILIKNDDDLKLDSKNLIKLIQFTGSLVALGGDSSMDVQQVSNLILPWIPEHYVHASKALPSGIDLMIAVFGSLCGDRIVENQWNPKRNGECLLSLTDHFKSTAPVFDLIFDRLNPMLERKQLKIANDTLLEKVESWMKDHHHPPFLTQKVATFAEQLEIPSPYQFFQLTEWIPKLNAESTAKSFNPLFFTDIARLLQNWVNTFLEVTASTEEKDGCAFIDWKKCEFQGEYDTADKLFNDEYATLVRHINLDFIYKISFYDSVSDYLIKGLDQDEDGLLMDDIKDLITIVVRVLDSNAFAQNVILRIQEKPVEMINTEKSIQTLRRQGLGEVAALAADLIPVRGGSKRSLIRKLTAQVYDSDKHVGFALDRLGLTTFIYVFDLIGNLRSQFLRDYNFQSETVGTTTWIKRRKIMELLPRILHDHFPRIYNECLNWGFERTCGVVFSEILPSPAEGKDTLEPSDIDTITLTSILLESMMNRCDRNQDDKLSTNILDGYDEKSCIMTVSKTLVNRLMNANIMKNERSTRTLLKAMQFPFVKPVGKVALERGTMKRIGFRVIPVVSWVSGPAYLGGVMSLAAEFMDDEKVMVIIYGEEGPVKDPGDELIYLDRLTNQHLPSKDWAPRTSAAARILYGDPVTH
jgi:hypothetical protein